MNPLFPTDDKQNPHKNPGYVLPRMKGKRIAPPGQKELSQSERNVAADLIRRKLEAMYEDEPSAGTEAAIVKHEPAAERSVHQQFMYKLSTSGKSLAEIQTEWHNYYVNLPDKQKHEVWREFYDVSSRTASPYTRFVSKQERPAPLEMPDVKNEKPPHTAVVSTHEHHPAVKRSKKPTGPRSIASAKKQILRKVQLSESAQTKARQHFKSLMFGISTGVVVLLVFLFGFFNEMIIAPFIQPSRHVSATPIIIGSSSVAPSATPEVIIPKINVQIPVVYDEKSVNEAAVQRALERGVIHYASTSLPGQKGNAAIFGHSSNNIFNKGKYKFAFVLLHELVPGDIFYITYNSQLYSYRVFDKKVVEPDEISVLNPVPGKAATATLITCDPPGTSLRRLVVWGEQVSPDPAAAAEPAAPTDAPSPSSLPSEGPTMFGRFIDWLF